MKKEILSKEQILNRLEKSSPEQLEARLEMKNSVQKHQTVPNYYWVCSWRK